MRVGKVEMLSVKCAREKEKLPAKKFFCATSVVLQFLHGSMLLSQDDKCWRMKQGPKQPSTKKTLPISTVKAVMNRELKQTLFIPTNGLLPVAIWLSQRGHSTIDISGKIT